MAEDAGIPADEFLALWRPTDDDRTIGKYTVDDVVEIILKEKGCYSDKLLRHIMEKRKETKRDCFRNLHAEIIPMLSELKKQGYLIGLITNCYSEETEVIRESVLYPYFDVPCFSYELGWMKPDERIYEDCMNKLGVCAEECLYVGDGGSYELETARKVGMEAAQAVWYLKDGTNQPAKRKPEFWQLETPMSVIDYLKKL